MANDGALRGRVCCMCLKTALMGPSICDVHTEGEGYQAQVASCGRPHRKLKLESTDVIVSFSHAKKLASSFTRVSSLDGIKSGNFSAI